MTTANNETGKRGTPAGWGLIVFLAGAGTMLFELLAPRMMQPFFGASSFVWTNVIGVILLALAVGYEVGGRLAKRKGHCRRISLALAGAAGMALALIALVPFLSESLLPSPEALAMGQSARSTLELGSLIVALVLFAPPVFALASVSAQIVHEMTALGMPAGMASGRVFMLGTLGSLLGTFMPTYLLIPQLGTRWSMVVAASMLLSAAALAWSFDRRDARLKSMATVLVLGLALSSFGFGRPIRPALEGEALIAEIESPFQYLRLVEADAEGIDVLKGDSEDDATLSELSLKIDEGLTEFHSLRTEGRKGTLGKYYDYFATLPSALPPNRSFKVLVLGSGTGTMARLMRDFWGDRAELIVNVEIDEEVVALTERFDPGGDRSRVATLVMDGRAALHAIDESFDFIFVDAYARQVDIPFHMATEEFFELAKSKLKSDGVLALNLSVADAAHSSLALSIAKTLQASGFSDPRSCWVRYWGNTMLWATADGHKLEFKHPVDKELAAIQTHIGRAQLGLEPAADDLVLTDDRAPLEVLVRSSLEQD